MLEQHNNAIKIFFEHKRYSLIESFDQFRLFFINICNDSNKNYNFNYKINSNILQRANKLAKSKFFITQMDEDEKEIVFFY